MPCILSYRIFLIIFFVALTHSARSDVQYASKDHWKFYKESCRLLPDAVDTVQKQMQQGSDVVFTEQILRNIDRMTDSLSHVSSSDTEPEKLSECESISKSSRVVLENAMEYENDVKRRQSTSARAEHEASQIYKKARALGFTDFEWLGALDLAYRKLGEKTLRTMMIVVDPDCERHFKAIQQVDPYVVFAPGTALNNACSGRERVAVLPAKEISFRRNQLIDQASYYVFQGVLEGKAIDGFPAKVLAIKQVPLKKNK